jgi:monoamine oxidase
VLFAGEHTSERWQGFMNGAVESGKRAAGEVRALAALQRLKS